MNWEAQYQRLSETGKEQFARLIGVLLQHSFILQDKFDSKTQSTQRNKDYRFVVQHLLLFETYLLAGGWSIKNDDTYGYVVIEHRHGSHRKSLDKLTTNLLYVLRLIYEEEREKLRMSHHVYTTLGDLHRMMENFLLQDKKVRKGTLQDALSTLKSYQIIELINGLEIADDAKILIYPSILYVVSNERLRILEQQIAEFNSEEVDEPEEEDVYE